MLLAAEIQTASDGEEDDPVLQEMDHLERLHLTCYANGRADYLKQLRRNKQNKERISRKKNEVIPDLQRAVEQRDVESGVVLRRYIDVPSAALAMHESQQSIVSCCRGFLDQVSGFNWTFYNGEAADIEDDGSYVSVQKLLLQKFKVQNKAMAGKQHDRPITLVATEHSAEFASKLYPPQPFAATKPVEQLDAETGEVLRRYRSLKEAGKCFRCLC